MFYILELIERKLPVTTFLFVLGYSKDKIINTFYSQINILTIKRQKVDLDFTLENFKRPQKLSYDLIDAQNNKKILNKGEKLNVVIAKKLKKKV